MVKTETSNEALELLDFLAENFLQQGRSISYILIDDLTALSVATEVGEPEIFVPFSSEGLSSDFFANYPKLQLTVPVLREEEQRRLHQLLEQIQINNIKIYRLSLYERYSFFSRQFLGNRKAG